MYRNKITLKPDTPNFPLKPVWVGVNSDALFVLDRVPAGCTARLYVTKINAAIAVYFDANISTTTGAVYIHVAGANFPAAGTGGKYEVLLLETTTGHSYWAGAGLLNVLPASNGTVTAGYGNAMDTYVRDPATGLYYRVWAEINEDGDVTTHTDQEGVELA